VVVTGGPISGAGVFAAGGVVRDTGSPEDLDTLGAASGFAAPEPASAVSAAGFGCVPTGSNARNGAAAVPGSATGELESLCGPSVAGRVVAEPGEASVGCRSLGAGTEAGGEISAWDRVCLPLRANA
jgi:hypothetical protein